MRDLHDGWNRISWFVQLSNPDKVTGQNLCPIGGLGFISFLFS